jgi:hypothetical protein
MNHEELSAVKRLYVEIGNAITLIPVPYGEDITPGERRTLEAVTGDLLRAEARLARLAGREAAR